MTDVTFNDIQKQLTRHITEQRDVLKNQLALAKGQYRVACDAYGNCSKQAGRYDKIACALQTAIEALDEVTETEASITIAEREVYIPLNADLDDEGVPVEFWEFNAFWTTHTTDDGFVLMYLDADNKFVK